jgi:hypothetical protein
MEFAMHYESMFRIDPDKKLRLKDIDPDYKGHHETERKPPPR